MDTFTDPPIAIIGMGALFAQATRLTNYWRLLYRGVDAVTEPPATHAHLEDYFDPDPKKPDHIYCKRGGFLPPIPFDPTEFGIPPATLEATDTSQLLGLVAAKMALGNAGYGEGGRAFDKEKTSVILGVTGTQELVVALGSRLGHPKWRRALDTAAVSAEKSRQVMDLISNAYVPWQENSFPGLLGNVVAGRICNRLDLGGTNCVVDAACASSLSAVHLSLLELATGRSRTVITGGVDTLNDIFMHMCFSQTGVLSKSGNASPFSKNADGTVLGEGVGLLVLKRLEDAEKDDDRIYAVIKGMGTSSDGKSQGIYAPRSEGQVRALELAYQRSGVSPDTIGLIEAHGTGTRVGDEVEFQSLVKIFGKRSDNSGPCALGSVKSMIGHTKAAAGSAGLIKAALSLYHKVLPPTLKADKPDPRLNIEKSPFYLPSQARPWPGSKEHPRRAAVSAFGFGGSNFHAVLEEYDAHRREPAWDNSVEILAFSGDTTTATAQRIKAVAEIPDLVRLPGQLAYTAAQSRKTFDNSHAHRLLLVVEKKSTAVELLQKAHQAVSTGGPLSNGLDATDIYYGSAAPAGKMAMVFPGQGSQYLEMGRDWFCTFPESLSALEKGNERWSGKGRLSDILFPLPAYSVEDKENRTLQLRHTHAAQMALGAVEAGMLAALRNFKVSAQAYCGHSYGELVALHAAGWCDLDTLLSLSDARGRSMAQAGKLSAENNPGDSGGMLAVSAPIEQIEQLAAELSPDIVLANKNSPSQGVLSGSAAGIEAARARCKKNGWRSVQLPVAAAFHSPLIEPALGPFTTAVQNAALTPGDIPVYSNVSAAPYPVDAESAAELLQKQMVSPVQFVETIENMHTAGIGTFLEVGPKRVLSGLIKAILPPERATVLSIDASGGVKNGLGDLARALCQLAAMGHSVDLTAWGEAPEKPRRPRMSVLLSGANYTSPKSTSAPGATAKRREKTSTPVKSVVKPAAIAAKQPAKSRDTVAVAAAQTPPKAFNSPPAKIRKNIAAPSLNPESTLNKFSKEAHTMPSNPPKGPNSDPIRESLAVVQQGIHSMQALHLQTAQTHQKFLEAQAEAGRTLQEMMRQTQLLTQMGFSAGHPTSSAPEIPSAAPQPTMPATDPSADRPVSAQPISMPPPPPSAPAPETVTAGNGRSPAAKPAVIPVPPESVGQNSGVDKIRKTLLTVVSELTGYPVEMLELNMDIESDLGIDSIKRVEILSTLEERMPGLPQVTPDMLGTLKTLGHIVDFLGSSTASEGINGPAEPSPGKAASAGKSNAAATLNQIQTTLLAVVAELTGYPVEMLELGMDIESDLGIDSIKRVEILSTLEERMPGLPQVTPDMLGTLKTLGQIVDFLGNSPESAAQEDQPLPTAPAAAQNHSNDDAIRTTLLSVVSELTGYPREMLEPTMDIESDLGIDSIKRVEILSTLEERMPGLPQVTPDMLGTLKTLGQIVDFLGSSPPPSTGNQAAADSDEIQRTLLLVVSELTGYPREMLEPTMDIESDLGIDSIKRVEILSTLEERLPGLPQVTPDMLGTLKTLGQIIDYLSGPGEATAAPAPAAQHPSLETETPGDAIEDSQPQDRAAPLTRQVVTLQNIAPPAAPAPTVDGPSGFIYITRDEEGLSELLAAAFENQGCKAKIIAPDLEEASTRWEDALGLLITSPIHPKEAFMLARAAADPLLQRAENQKPALFATISRIDGAFGFYGAALEDPHQGALAGLAKTAALEWAGVTCRAFDIAPELTPSLDTAGTVVDDLLSATPGGPIEIGISEKGRITLELTESHAKDGSITLEPEDVVIITGGGRGVTAEAAIALADKHPCKMVLIGRSPAPCKEPQWLAGIGEPAAMKKAILAHEFSSRKATPMELEQKFRKWQAGRDISTTLARIAATGASGIYVSQDIRDSAAVTDCLNKIRGEIGPIRGIIHGAGILQDRLIREKTVDQFQRVYRTKVDALTPLLDAVKNDDLKYLIFFSSVSARVGNRGQVDYAMANEILNKTAWQQRHLRPRCKVVSINWGPWDGGMVDETLKREFQRNGIRLIPLAAGSQAMVREMAVPLDGPVEVVIGATFAHSRGDRKEKKDANELLTLPQPAVDPQPDALSLLIKREINLQHYPVLQDHILGGKPVVPLALMAEWLGHSALHENPGLIFHGIDALRLMSGIKLDREIKQIHLMAGKARRREELFEVDVEIRNGNVDGKDVIHSRATTLLADRLPPAPAYQGPKISTTSHGITKSVSDIYSEILFHGERLKGIQAIPFLSSEGMAARLAGAPEPEHWMADPLRSQWILDPLVLDCAFQMAIIWCHEQLGKRCLPSFAATYRQYREVFPDQGVTAILSVRKTDSVKMIGDFTFLDQNGEMIARMNGYEAIMDAALEKAFRQRNAA